MDIFSFVTDRCEFTGIFTIINNNLSDDDIKCLITQVQYMHFQICLEYVC